MLERRGTKISHNETEYMCVNEREASETVRLQGVRWRTSMIKYLGSTGQYNRSGERDRVASAGRMEWVEESVRSDL